MSREPELQSRHPPRWRRWLRRMAIAVLVLILAGAVGFVVSPRWRLIANIWLSGGVYVEQHLEPFHKRHYCCAGPARPRMKYAMSV